MDYKTILELGQLFVSIILIPAVAYLFKLERRVYRMELMLIQIGDKVGIKIAEKNI